ncbi:Disease resistance RPP8-like protein 3 [Citrus sinensis]|nr:Disease resistance RPP8-like protein 3 [Citrus sinensis]
MEMNLILFSDRLKRVLAGEDGALTLPDSTNLKPVLQYFLSEIEIITMLRDYKSDINRLLIQLWNVEEDVDRPDVLSILNDINYFVYESEKAIDAFFTTIMQPQSSESESESESTSYKDALVGLQRFEKRDMEEALLDLLIEGQPQLSVVAILDSREAFNSNHVKFYFDCRAWVRVSIQYNFKKILDDIIKSVMPASGLSEIIGKDYTLKKSILRDYLTNKKYMIVLDDIYHVMIWNDLREALPDYQNGSRVLITVVDPDILTSFELENGEKIGKSHMMEMENEPTALLFCSIFELPLYLKFCCFYLCVFYGNLETSTRQLYQLWMAEGFVAHNSEANAEEYLKELISRGLIKVGKRSAGGKIKTCSVPSSVWARLVVLAAKMKFVMVLDLGLVEELRTIKRFAVPKNLTKFVSLEHIDTYLHSLQNFALESDHSALLDCENICKKFKLLRVLNMGSLVLDQFPSGIENLFLLRCLKLDVPSLKSLPSSLCNLLNLQTLDMPSSYIDHTPEDIWNMHKLMHLNFGCITLPAPPENYCSSLKNLIFISALHPCSCTPDTLGRLPNVQTLKIYGDLSNYQSGLSKSLRELLKLESLKLVNKSKGWQLSQMVLSEYQFPPSLTQLSLSNTELKEDPMPTLEKLPHLLVLKLKQNSYSGRKLACVGSGGFPKLKILHLKSMFWLEEWTMGARAMTKLESLIINPCAYLKKLPEELWRIESFRKLELHWPQPELRKKLRAYEDMERRYDIQMYPYGI